MEKKKYLVIYGHTSYYTKEFEASNADEASDIADNDWCEGNEWHETQNGEGLGVIEVKEQ